MKLIDLLEALPISTARAYHRVWEPGKYQELFQSFPDKDKRAYRIYFPLDNAIITKDGEEPIIPLPIRKHIKSKGYNYANYLQGLAWNSKDERRKVKIGKLLSDAPELLKQYNEDPTRNNVKKQNLWVVISRHPYDIAAMSTNRGWTSCMNLEDGSNKKYVAADVQYGTLVAYVIESNDRNIQHPISRLLIKPFISTDNAEYSILVQEEYQYGTEVDGFNEIVQRFCDKANGEEIGGLYCLNPKLYTDNSDKEKYHNIDKLSDKKIKNLLRYSKNTKELFRNLKNPSEEVQQAAVEIDGNAIQYIKNPSEKVKELAIESAPFSIQYIKDASEDLQFMAVKQNINVFSAIKNPSEELQLYAMSVEPRYIHTISNPSIEVQKVVANTNPSMVDLIRNPSEEAQLIAISKKPDLIYRLKNPTPKVIALAKSLGVE